MCDSDKQRDAGSSGDVVGRPSERVSLRMAVGAQFPLCWTVFAGPLERPRPQVLEEQPRRQRSERELRQGNKWNREIPTQRYSSILLHVGLKALNVRIL